MNIHRLSRSSGSPNAPKSRARWGGTTTRSTILGEGNPSMNETSSVAGSIVVSANQQVTAIDSTIASVKTRACESCHEPIPQARLRAVPNARQCVACLTAAGDVPLLRRFDQHANGEQSTPYFTTDQRAANRISRHASRSLHHAIVTHRHEQAIADEGWRETIVTPENSSIRSSSLGEVIQHASRAA